MLVCVLSVTVRVLSALSVTGVVGKGAALPDHTQRRHWDYMNFLYPAEPGTILFPEILANSCSPSKFTANNYTECGDTYCRCTKTIADCSERHDNLTYVPVLPAGILHLNLSWNGLTSITRDDFFQNVTNITVLDLTFNFLSYFCSGAFRPLVNLRHLWLGGNSLTYNQLSSVLSVATLRLLELSGNPLGDPPDDLFHNYSLPDLQVLCFVEAMLSQINMSIFSPLPMLSTLAVWGNKLSSETLTPYFLPQLRSLELALNVFQVLPETCKDDGSFLPNLTQLDMSLNPMLRFPSTPACLPSLKIFSCLNCFISIIPTNTFGDHMFPSINAIVLSGGLPGQGLFSMEKYAFNNTMLETLLISDSSCDFSRDSIHPDCFAGCPNLKTIIVSGNDFSRVSEQKLQRLFNSDHLIELSLSSNNLDHISAEMFSNLPQLSALWLGSNKLTDIPDGVFDRLEHLEQLDLSANRISVVRVTAFSPATRRRLTQVFLDGNAFQCDCELRWFQHWLNSEPDTFSHCFDEFLDVVPCKPYACDNLANTTVQSFYVADQACLWSPAVSKFIIASFILLMLPLTAGTLIYRYRWHIRLVLYEAVRGRGDRRRRLQEQCFRYDVFVCYDSEDQNWVLAHLMPELEGRLELRLCVHQRDFTPGAPIVENIEESVQTSKKIMMLFSKNFADSHWCQFELQLCLTHVLEHDDALLVVLLEDIPSRDLTLAMMAVMKTVTYIEWGGEPEARASFWGHVRLALNEILV